MTAFGGFFGVRLAAVFCGFAGMRVCVVAVTAAAAQQQRQQQRRDPRSRGHGNRSCEVPAQCAGGGKR